MIRLDSLAEQARTSEDGEAYLAVAKEPGYRIGVGARASMERDPEFFVEVVLDPFPDRPEVNPGVLADRSALLERLRRRGYALSCDDAGVVTCERKLSRAASAGEAKAISGLLRPPRKSSRRHAQP